jgi:N utilization substance protein A
MELEKDHLYNKYKERVGEIITGEVYQIWKRETLVLDDEGNELIMPKDQQIKTDFFKKGDTVRAVVWKVEMRNNSPVVLLSRTAPEFLEKLFEQEVPEVADGLITIKRIVREPGERAKVAVESYDDRIDPVGACVGMKGSRIHGIVRELRNENIDVINWTPQRPAAHPARAEPGQGGRHQAGRGQQAGRGVHEARSGGAGHRQGGSQHQARRAPHGLRSTCTATAMK